MPSSPVPLATGACPTLSPERPTTQPSPSAPSLPPPPAPEPNPTAKSQRATSYLSNSDSRISPDPPRSLTPVSSQPHAGQEHREHTAGLPALPPAPPLRVALSGPSPATPSATLDYAGPPGPHPPSPAHSLGRTKAHAPHLPHRGNPQPTWATLLHRLTHPHTNTARPMPYHHTCSHACSPFDVLPLYTTHHVHLLFEQCTITHTPLSWGHHTITDL